MVPVHPIRRSPSSGFEAIFKDFRVLWRRHGCCAWRCQKSSLEPHLHGLSKWSFETSIDTSKCAHVIVWFSRFLSYLHRKANCTSIHMQDSNLHLPKSDGFVKSWVLLCYFSFFGFVMPPKLIAFDNFEYFFEIPNQNMLTREIGLMEYFFFFSHWNLNWSVQQPIWNFLSVE